MFSDTQESSFQLNMKLGFHMKVTDVGFILT